VLAVQSAPHAPLVPTVMGWKFVAALCFESYVEVAEGWECGLALA
jgi:hypothetical protein